VINLRSVDLNLLPIFEAAYEERNLSKAAVRLAMTQPAVSHALSRLRHAFKDELFVRHPRGMTPTPVADAIHGRLGEALGLVRSTIADSRGFDPKVSERRFVIAIPHPLGPMLALRLLERVSKAAPNVALEFSTRSRPVDLDRGLLEGTTDVAVDWLPAGRAGLVDEEVVQDELVIVARRGHRGARDGMTRKALVANNRFVSLRPRLDMAEHPLEGVREWLHLKPTVSLQVSELIEVLVVAAESDLLGIVPRSLAKASLGALDIRVVMPSPRSKSFPIRMVWRKTRGADPAHKFLRDQVRAAMKAVIKI
jgi:DNA-binding transcriptional LysR family regulator